MVLIIYMGQDQPSSSGWLQCILAKPEYCLGTQNFLQSLQASVLQVTGNGEIELVGHGCEKRLSTAYDCIGLKAEQLH